tara:strand:- start:440 stop:967 length:528 start_codon:yes stop_codon:yes gene_type:complete
MNRRTSIYIQAFIVFIIIEIIKYLYNYYSYEQDTDYSVIRKLREQCKARLKPSKIHGIGVFAIEDIKKGEILFTDIDDSDNSYYYIECNLLEQGLSKGQYDYIQSVSDYYESDEKCEHEISDSPNIIHMTSYLNHSDKNQNVSFDKKIDKWKCIKDIKKDEELLWNYNETNSENF